MTRKADADEKSSGQYLLVLGSSRGLSTTYVIHVKEKKAVLHDRIRKSAEEDDISGTIFYKTGTIASTSQGKLIRIVNKLNPIASPSTHSSGKESSKTRTGKQGGAN